MTKLQMKQSSKFKNNDVMVCKDRITRSVHSDLQTLEVLEGLNNPVGKLYKFLGSKEERIIFPYKDNIGMFFTIGSQEFILVFNFSGRFKDLITFFDIEKRDKYYPSRSVKIKASFSKEVRGHNFAPDLYLSLSEEGMVAKVPNDIAFKRFLDLSKKYLESEEKELLEVEDRWNDVCIQRVICYSPNSTQVVLSRNIYAGDLDRFEFKISSVSADGEYSLEDLYKITKLNNGIMSISKVGSEGIYEDEIKPSFVLTPDIKKNAVELGRKKDAVLKLDKEKDRYKDIWDLLVEPEAIEADVEEYEDVEFITRDNLSFDTQETVKKCLRDEIIHLVQGPPGTGKTTLITELAAQFIEAGDNIIVSAKENLAIDNVIEKLTKAGIPLDNAVRLGRKEKIKLTDAEEILAINQVEKMIDESKKQVSLALELLRSPEFKSIADGSLDRVRALLSEKEEFESQLEDSYKQIDFAKINLQKQLRQTEVFQDIEAEADINFKKIIKQFLKHSPHNRKFLYETLQDIFNENDADSRSLVSQLHEIKTDPANAFCGGDAVIKSCLENIYEIDENDAQFVAEIIDSFEIVDLKVFTGILLPKEFIAFLEYIMGQSPENDELSKIQKEIDDLEVLVNNLKLSILECNTELEKYNHSISPEYLDSIPSIFLDKDFKNFSDEYCQILEDYQKKIKHDSDSLTSYLVSSSNIIFSTCSLLAQKSFKDIARRFDACIVDEASKAELPDLLIPMMLSNKFILVGDHYQLPPSITGLENNPYRNEIKQELTRSTFERLYDSLGDRFKTKLKTQYRMHPQVSAAISNVYYEGELIDSDSIKNKNYTLEPFSFFHVNGKEEQNKQSKSFFNQAEIDHCMKILKQCVEKYPGKSIGIISGYKLQNEKMQQAIDSDKDLANSDQIEAGTIDAFQGRQKDIIIISSVRTSKNVGYLSDRQRLNVAFSRSREVICLVGHSNILKNENINEIVLELSKKDVKSAA